MSSAAAPKLNLSFFVNFAVWERWKPIEANSTGSGSLFLVYRILRGRISTSFVSGQTDPRSRKGRKMKSLTDFARTAVSPSSKQVQNKMSAESANSKSPLLKGNNDPFEKARLKREKSSRQDNLEVIWKKVSLGRLAQAAIKSER